MSATTQAIQAASTRGHVAFMPYVTAGFPELDATPDVVEALTRGGASVIEFGIPFSDPIADGVAVQRSGQRALANGVTLAKCLDIARECRQRVTTPLVFMGYYNPFLQYGLARFCAAAVDAGVNGVIVPDLPPEEAQEFAAAAQHARLDLAFLVATNSSERRIATICAQTAGFVYCVTVRGVTGERTSLPADLPPFFQRVRQHTQLPLGAGFGIGTPAQVMEVGKYVEAAFVGSAFVSLLERTPVERRLEVVEAYARSMSSVASGLHSGQGAILAGA